MMFAFIPCIHEALHWDGVPDLSPSVDLSLFSSLSLYIPLFISCSARRSVFMYTLYQSPF